MTKFKHSDSNIVVEASYSSVCDTRPHVVFVQISAVISEIEWRAHQACVSVYVILGCSEVVHRQVLDFYWKDGESGHDVSFEVSWLTSSSL